MEERANFMGRKITWDGLFGRDNHNNTFKIVTHSNRLGVEVNSRNTYELDISSLKQQVENSNAFLQNYTLLFFQPSMILLDFVKAVDAAGAIYSPYHVYVSADKIELTFPNLKNCKTPLLVLFKNIIIHSNIMNRGHLTLQILSNGEMTFI